MKVRSRFLGEKFEQSVTIPPLLLAVAFACVFIFQNDAHSFSNDAHGFLSSHGMTVSAHLSSEHRFLMLNRVLRDKDGSVRYSVYNRFPIGAFAAIRLATYSFQHDLSMQIAIARSLMNLFFVAAAYFAYLSLLRLGKNRWVAAIATLLAFSSYYCLLYNDMIFNDVPTMFGLLLVFHGMVLFLQEGRFYQLVAKSGVALFLGWQVYAILLPFTLIGIVIDLFLTRSLRGVVQSRYFALGTISLLVGVVILTVNLTGEYLATEALIQELPTVQKMLWRFGLADAGEYEERHESELVWDTFFEEQTYRVGRMSLPYAWRNWAPLTSQLVLWGRIAFVASLAAAAFLRWRVATISLVLSGICWALPMRYFVAFHDFQSLYYIGIPLIFFYAIALSVRKIPRILPGLACVALLVFILSCVQLNVEKSNNRDNGRNTFTTDFQRIANKVSRQRNVFINGDHSTMGGAFHATSFYLARNYVVQSREEADFIVSAIPVDNAMLLTPNNERVFLYAPNIEPNAEPEPDVADGSQQVAEATTDTQLTVTRTIIRHSGIPTGTIALLPFLDTNGNGGIDPGEMNAVGVLASLIDSEEEVLQTLESSDAGISFTELEIGQYILRIEDGGTHGTLSGHQISVELREQDVQGIAIFMGIAE